MNRVIDISQTETGVLTGERVELHLTMQGSKLEVSLCM